MYSFCLFVIIFFVYSFIGYVIEVTSVTRERKKITMSRGYMMGPYLPIFGVGSIIMISVLQKYQGDLVALFVLSMMICSILEYITSYLLEKLFHLRWWDYSKEKSNLNGRICLKNAIGFGLGGMIIVEYFHPMLMSLLDLLPMITVEITGMILFVILFLDFVLSTYMIVNLRIDVKKLKEDHTDMIKQEVKKSLQRRKIFYRRILKSYPSLSKNKTFENVKELIQKRKGAKK